MSLDNNNTVELTYHPTPDYHYRIVANLESYRLTYVEHHNRKFDRDISFESLEEMEDVAKLMLKTVEAARSLK